MPADWGRAQLENLDFVAGCEDLVLYGPVGTGKSHLAIAIGVCVQLVVAGLVTMIFRV